MNGKVKWFDNKKGFGFITPDEPGLPEHFVHHSQIAAKGYRQLHEGDVVEFEEGTGDRGPRALNVRVLRHADPPPHLTPRT